MPTLDDQLEQDLRAIRPDIDHEFEGELGRRVAAGFPSPRRSPKRWPLRPLLATAAVAASALVAVVVVAQRDAVEPISGDVASTFGDSAGDAAAGVVTESAAPQADLAAPSAAAPAPAPSRRRKPAAPSAIPQKVERAAQLALSTAPEEVQRVANGVVKATQAAGGRVTSSQVATAADGGSASFTLRIPTARLDRALAALSDLANVDSLNQDTSDITSGFVSAADRLGDARAERKAILRALGRASNAGQIATLRRRLALNSSEISRYKGELNALRRRADLSTVDVTVAGTGKTKADDGSGAWSPGDAANDALRVLEVAVGVGLVALAVLAPLAVLGLMAALAARGLRRRRREVALDAA